MENPVTTALLAALMHSTEPMVLSDPRLPDHPMIAVNPAFEALSGYPAAMTVGRNCRFLQGDDTDPETAARIRRCIAERRGCVEWIINYRRDGSRFWNLLFLSPVLDRDGSLLHYFGNQRDITLGLPAGMPEFTTGAKAQGQAFHSMVLGMLDQPVPSDGIAGRARSLERIVEMSRQLNEVTTHLAPAPWMPRL